MARGRVKFFDDRKGFGRIVADTGEEFHVHRTEILSQDVRTLATDEAVEFEPHYNDRGGVATGVRRLEMRLLGTVVRFYRERGWGYIVPDDDREIAGELFVHYTSVDWPGRVNLLQDERVEFTPILAPKGWQAVKVKRLDPRRGLDRFAFIADREAKIEELAAIAQNEVWDYRHQEQPYPKPILRSYLYDTFDRLKVEDKTAVSTAENGQPVACFNTGLVTQLQEQIFAYCIANRSNQANREEWVLVGFLKESDRRMSSFPAKPDIANYFTDPTDLLYDTRLELTVDYEHIARDNRDRFPEKLREDEFLRNAALQSAINLAKRRVRGNYKAAIPQFYQGQLQLLLPLCLLAPDRADLALVVEHKQHGYRGATVLPLDWAYENARLIARPDREWLEP